MSMDIHEEMVCAAAAEKARLSKFGVEHRSWKDRIADHKGPPEFVIDGYVPRGIMTTLYGRDGLGKSTLTVLLAIQLAVGRSALLAAPKAPQRVLYISPEDPERAVIDRFHRIVKMLDLTEEEFELVEQNFDMPDMTGTDITVMKFDREGEASPRTFAHQLQARLETDNLDLVILDPISDVYSDNENDFTKVAAMMRHLNQLAMANDTAIMLIGHPAKDESSTYGGSRAWSSKSRSRLLLQKTTGDPFPKLSQQKSSYGPTMRDIDCLWDKDWGVLKPVGSALAEVIMKNNLEPVMDDLLHGIRELANRCVVAKTTTTSRTLYLPKALHDAGLCKQHAVESLHEAMNLLISKKMLVANCTFDGTCGPKIMDSSRHPKTGIWFGDDSMRTENYPEKKRL
jgi:archaellum biogenesis ATPase FlaH